jgi:hypothetical protein
VCVCVCVGHTHTQRYIEQKSSLESKRLDSVIVYSVAGLVSPVATSGQPLHIPCHSCWPDGSVSGLVNLCWHETTRSVSRFGWLKTFRTMFCTKRLDSPLGYKRNTLLLRRVWSTNYITYLWSLSTIAEIPEAWVSPISPTNSNPFMERKRGGPDQEFYSGKLNPLSSSLSFTHGFVGNPRLLG